MFSGIAKVYGRHRGVAWETLIVINPETIKEFQEAVKKDHGVVISLQESEETLRGLVGYYDKLAEIDSRGNVEDPALIS